MDHQPATLALLPEGGDRKALLGRVEGAIADVRASGGTIAYVRVGFTEADWGAIPALSKSFAPLAQHRAMHHEDPAAAIHERLAPQDGDVIVRKIRYGGMSTFSRDPEGGHGAHGGGGGYVAPCATVPGSASPCSMPSRAADSFSKESATRWNSATPRRPAN